jgi:iron complex transport system substrate-binding protein
MRRVESMQGDVQHAPTRAVRRRWRSALAALCGLLVSGAVVAAPYELQDEGGARVRFEAPPQRIVSLLPSLTETVCALGACARLVGVDRYSNFPAEVQALPQLGGGIDPNLEALVRLQPDLVLLSRASRLEGRMRALGLKVMVLEPQRHADVERVLTTLGQVLYGPGDVRAAQVWHGIQDGVARAAASVPVSARQARVYIEVNQGPYAASPASYIGETLARLGPSNIVPATLGPFPKLNPEFVVRADPDVIMVGNRSMQGGFTYPGWERLRAVRTQRVCVFTTAEADILVRSGPRMDQAAAIMARCLADKVP